MSALTNAARDDPVRRSTSTIRGERREQEARQKENVVRRRPGWTPGGPQRDRRHRRQEHRVGERQRQRLGVEDVAAEERPRVATPLLVDPAHPPHRKERIAEIRHRVHPPQLRLQQDRAKQRGCQAWPALRAPTHDQTGVSRASAAAAETRRARHCCQRGRSTPNGRTPGANHHRMASAIAAGIRPGRRCASTAERRRSRCRSRLSTPCRRRRRRASGQASRGRSLPAVATARRPVSIVCRTSAGGAATGRGAC